MSRALRHVDDKELGSTLLRLHQLLRLRLRDEGLRVPPGLVQVQLNARAAPCKRYGLAKQDGLLHSVGEGVDVCLGHEVIRGVDLLGARARHAHTPAFRWCEVRILIRAGVLCEEALVEHLPLI